MRGSSSSRSRSADRTSPRRARGPKPPPPIPRPQPRRCMWRGPQRPPCECAPNSIQGAGEVKLCCMGNPLVVKVTRSVAIYRRHVAWLVSAALPLVAAPTAPAAPGGLPDCALAGRAADRAPVERLIASRVRRFGGGVVARRTYAAGLAAYVYGLPPVMLHRTVETFPRNTLVGIAKLADETTDSIVAPNQDTLYSVAWIDLSAARSCSRRRPRTGATPSSSSSTGSPTRRPTSATASAARLASAWPSCRPASPAPCPPACGASGCRRRPRGCSAERSSTPGRRTSPSRGRS